MEVDTADIDLSPAKLMPLRYSIWITQSTDEVTFFTILVFVFALDTGALQDSKNVIYSISDYTSDKPFTLEGWN